MLNEYDDSEYTYPPRPKLPLRPSGLERELGTKLIVSGFENGQSYEGTVEKVTPKFVHVYHQVDNTIVYYSHAFTGFTVTVLAPAAHKITRLKVTKEGCFYAKVDPSGRSYEMTDAEYLIEHFTITNPHEKEWFKTVRDGTAPVDRDGFATRQVGAKEGDKMPLCVLGSLRKAFDFLGYSHAAQVVEEHYDESLQARDRIKHAGTLALSMKLHAPKVHLNALECTVEHPTLLQVSRTHAVTLLGNLIFDYNEPAPLVRTAANLARCIGAPYSGDIVRGYMFMPQLAKRKAVTENDPCNSPKRKR